MNECSIIHSKYQLLNHAQLNLSPQDGRNSSNAAARSACVLVVSCCSTLIVSRMFWYFDFKKARYNVSNSPISLVYSLSRKPLTPAKRTTTCSSAAIGTYCFCFKISWSFSPLLRSYWVDASRSEPNWAKAATSLYWASSNFIEPDTCFIALIWAADPTLDTERPTLIAGLIPL